MIPPDYVKPFVKRQKNDAADAEAIAKRRVRPTMRFVAVKTEEQQARAMLFRTRDLLVRQRTQLINALRGHLAEHGVVAPQGPTNMKVLAEAIERKRRPFRFSWWNSRASSSIRSTGYRRRSPNSRRRQFRKPRAERRCARLQTMPGVGPITALAIETFAPPMGVFRRGRDFAAWLGLVPGNTRPAASRFSGKISKMGQRDIRRLLIIGAMAIVRWACRKGGPEGSWLHRMLARKPRMLLAIALANKMARAIWAMLTKGEDYRVPAAATL